MSGRDTLVYRITKTTAEELERIRRAIARDLGVDEKFVTKRHAEIALRVKASRGKLLKSELNDILIGKVK